MDNVHHTCCLPRGGLRCRIIGRDLRADARSGKTDSGIASATEALVNQFCLFSLNELERLLANRKRSSF